METQDAGWKLVEGPVDVSKEHFKLEYEGYANPLGAVAKGRWRTFTVEYRPGAKFPDGATLQAMREIKKDINSCLLNENRFDPWGNAVARANSVTKSKSKVRWYYYPHGET